MIPAYLRLSFPDARLPCAATRNMMRLVSRSAGVERIHGAYEAEAE
jgi:hypothetical protein